MKYIWQEKMNTEYSFIHAQNISESSKAWRTRLPTYFTLFRIEVLQFIPANTERLLSVGCGEGNTEVFIKQRLGVREVYAIEKDPEVASKLKKVLDGVFIGDAEEIALPFPPAYLDCILYLDILEHLKDPWALLKKHKVFLKPGSTIIVSIPNVRYYLTFVRLLFGDWIYSNRGIFDWSHLRFFTLRSAKRMLIDAGYKVKVIRRKYRLADVVSDRLAIKVFTKVTDIISRLLIARLLGFLPYFREFFVFQYLIVARNDDD